MSSLVTTEAKNIEAKLEIDIVLDIVWNWFLYICSMTLQVSQCSSYISLVSQLNWVSKQAMS